MGPYDYASLRYFLVDAAPFSAAGAPAGAGSGKSQAPKNGGADAEDPPEKLEEPAGEAQEKPKPGLSGKFLAERSKCGDEVGVQLTGENMPSSAQVKVEIKAVQGDGVVATLNGALSSTLENPQSHRRHVLRPSGSLRILLGLPGLVQSENGRRLGGNGLMGRSRTPKFTAAAALSILTWTACQGGKPQGANMSTLIEIRYWSTAADETMPLSLSVFPATHADLWLPCNRDHAAQAALGRFRKTVDGSEVKPILSAVEAEGFLGSANPPSVLPGEVVRKITLKYADGRESMRFQGEEGKASEGFARAEQSLLAMLRTVERHPLASLSFHGDALPAQTVQGHVLGFSLILTNAGKETLRVPMPSAWAATQTGLEARGLRSDIPLDKLDNSHAPALALSARHLAPGWKAPAAGDDMELRPGQTLALPFQTVLTWIPGDYDLRLIYSSSLGESSPSGSDRIEWVSPPFKFTVLPSK
ncbi:MAG TPA: hypothetical protein VJ385_19595 [Fibrobacteria bacterium]|nr:hypothetical protein [Fibrobacteria bacterium]